jgi:hypothetical protein
VIAYWRNNLWFESGLPDSASNEFYRQANKKIKQILKFRDTKVKIACLSDDHDHIVGCSVMTGKNVEWVYVKMDCRWQKIATYLCKEFETVSPPMTKIGNAIVRDHGYKIKGEFHGRSKEEESKQS